MILVTGGTGLIGAHLLYKLTNENEKVRAIYRSKQKLKEVEYVFSTYTSNYQELFNKIEWVKADLLDIPALNETLKNINYVYHCAALVSFQPQEFSLLRRINIEGTANVVNLCLSNNIKKLCYVSSIATLGNEPTGTPITENSIWNPEDDHNVYAISKYGAEMEVWRGTQEGLNTVIVNPGVVMGAGLWDKGSSGLFKKADHGIPFYTSGTVALVAVEDVVDIMITLLKSNIKNERFILVSKNLSYQDFITTLCLSVNKKAPKFLAPKSLLTVFWKLDWIKHNLTGLSRKITKHTANSLCSKTYYSNSKVETLLSYEFKNINDYIMQVGATYLKQK